MSRVALKDRFKVKGWSREHDGKVTDVLAVLKKQKWEKEWPAEYSEPVYFAKIAAREEEFPNFPEPVQTIEAIKAALDALQRGGILLNWHDDHENNGTDTLPPGSIGLSKSDFKALGLQQQLVGGVKPRERATPRSSSKGTKRSK